MSGYRGRRIDFVNIYFGWELLRIFWPLLIVLFPLYVLFVTVRGFFRLFQDTAPAPTPVIRYSPPAEDDQYLFVGGRPAPEPTRFDW